MDIIIGSDHGGFNLKATLIEWLEANQYTVTDAGTYSEESCDYPDIAYKVANSVADGTYEKGVLICGTGLGVSITANKVPGIRAAVCGDTFSAKMSRMHNDANILALGARVIGFGLAIDILETWLNAEFEGGRHINRVAKIEPGR